MSADPAQAARIAALKQLSAGVQGWLSLELTAPLLYRLAFEANPAELVVELGSWKGLSTLWFAAGVADRGRGRVIAVDTWKGSADELMHSELLAGYGEDQLYREFLDNMARAGVANWIEPLRSTTRAAALAWRRGVSIGVLHIDAGHSYDDVRAEFELWSPLVVDGGFIVFDDVPSWLGPSRVVSELPPWYRVAAMPPNKWVVQKLKS